MLSVSRRAGTAVLLVLALTGAFASVDCASPARVDCAAYRGECPLGCATVSVRLLDTDRSCLAPDPLPPCRDVDVPRPAYTACCVDTGDGKTRAVPGGCGFAGYRACDAQESSAFFAVTRPC